MFLLFFSVLVVALAYNALRLYRAFQRNLQNVKKTGVPYIVCPYPATGLFWLVVSDLTGPIFRRLSWTKDRDWIPLVERQRAFSEIRAAEEKHGDTYFLVNPFRNQLITTNAELSSQITARRADFLKPVAGYGIVELFGRNVVTTEGQEWKRHRKVVAPSFSEKSNKLVFEESLRQADKMVRFWAGQGSTDDIWIENTAKATSELSLNVICAAGFGVPQSWPGDSAGEGCSEEKAKGSTSTENTGRHLPLKPGLLQVVRHIIWFVPFPKWFLRISPFKFHNDAYIAYTSCTSNFSKLMESKIEQISRGQNDQGTMDLMGQMVRASQDAPDELSLEKGKSALLTREEIIGNSFIFLFAGHETSANAIHYSMIQLAMSLPAQRHMQADIDKIVGDKSTSEFSYHTDMPRLYNSMVGAVQCETVRLVPAILFVPKITAGDHEVWQDGQQFTVPNDTYVHINVPGTNTNPRYWPSSPQAFMPERWLPQGNASDGQTKKQQEIEKTEADQERASFETSNSSSLYVPIKGSFPTFSDGARVCPGKRFAQVEITAVLAALFQKYSVELDVSDWASDEQLKGMTTEEKKTIYEKASKRATEVVKRSEQLITLQMRKGDHVPVRLVARGKERFSDLFR